MTGGDVQRAVRSACAMLQMAGWSEANNVSSFGASVIRPSRLSDSPENRPLAKSVYVFISHDAVVEASRHAAPANRAAIERIIP